ncbi:unnamed protein product [Closterium sp. Naga37s-1]|nr:unnamed protein product [Closterium sp. Naga37s-1]
MATVRAFSSLATCIRPSRFLHLPLSPHPFAALAPCICPPCSLHSPLHSPIPLPPFDSLPQSAPPRFLHAPLLLPACASMAPCMRLYCSLHAPLLLPACASIAPCMRLYCSLHAPLWLPACAPLAPFMRMCSTAPMRDHDGGLHGSSPEALIHVWWACRGRVPEAVKAAGSSARGAQGGRERPSHRQSLSPPCLPPRPPPPPSPPLLPLRARRLPCRGRVPEAVKAAVSDPPIANPSPPHLPPPPPTSPSSPPVSPPLPGRMGLAGVECQRRSRRPGRVPEALKAAVSDPPIATPSPLLPSPPLLRAWNLQGLSARGAQGGRERPSHCHPFSSRRLPASPSLPPPPFLGARACRGRVPEALKAAVSDPPIATRDQKCKVDGAGGQLGGGAAGHQLGGGAAGAGAAPCHSVQRALAQSFASFAKPLPCRATACPAVLLRGAQDVDREEVQRALMLSFDSVFKSLPFHSVLCPPMQVRGEQDVNWEVVQRAPVPLRAAPCSGRRCRSVQQALAQSYSSFTNFLPLVALPCEQDANWEVVQRALVAVEDVDGAIAGWVSRLTSQSAGGSRVEDVDGAIAGLKSEGCDTLMRVDSKLGALVAEEDVDGAIAGYLYRALRTGDALLCAPSPHSAVPPAPRRAPCTPPCPLHPAVPPAPRRAPCTPPCPLHPAVPPAPRRAPCTPLCPSSILTCPPT